MKFVSVKDKLRYRIDQFFQSGFALQMVIALLIVIGAASVFFLIAETLQIMPGADFEKTPDELKVYWPGVRFWWVVTHMLESYWIERSTMTQVVSVMLTLFNFLIFAVVIGLVGSKIQARFESMRRGTSRVIESGHYAVIGWNESIIPFIHELHIGLETVRKVIVIFSQHPIDQVEKEIRKTLGRLPGTRVVIRQGSSTDVADLRLISVNTAKTIIILNNGTAKRDGDAGVVKTIMAVNYLLDNNSANSNSKPNIIAELERRESFPLAHAAADGLKVSIVQPSDYMSKIILQTARQRGLVRVYEEILSHEFNELHTAPIERYPELEGRNWREVVFSFPNAVPIGVIRGKQAVLAPRVPESFYCRQGDRLVFIARDSRSLQTAPMKSAPSLRPASISSGLHHATSFFMIGCNEKSEPLLTECNAYARSAGARFTVFLIGTSPLLEQLMLRQSQFESLDLQWVYENYFHQDVLERYDPLSYDTIIVLGEDNATDDWERPDNRVIMTLLLLRQMRLDAEREGRPISASRQIVCEIRNPDNKVLADSTRSSNDVIISSQLISRMLAQICRESEVEVVLRDFFDEAGAEIYLKPLRLYADGDVVSFQQVQAAALARGEVAIGVEAAEDESWQGKNIALNPRRDAMFRVYEYARAVVISEHEL